MDPSEARTILQQEITRIIIRAGSEMDLSVYETLGVLRIVEHNLIAMLDGFNKEKDEGPIPEDGK